MKRLVKNSRNNFCRKNIVLIAVSAATIGLVACGANTANQDRNASGAAVSVGVISGSAVSGSAVSPSSVDENGDVGKRNGDGEKKSEIPGSNSFVKNALLNSTNRYAMDEDYYDSKRKNRILQYSSDGKNLENKIVLKEEKKIGEGKCVFADDTGLIYCVFRKESKKPSVMDCYEIPLKKGNDKDTVKAEDRKKLFTLELAAEEETYGYVQEHIYADSDYVIAVSDDGQVFRYDRKSKKLRKENPFGSLSKQYSCCVVNTYASEKELYVQLLSRKTNCEDQSVSGELYCLKPDSMKWEKLIETEDSISEYEVEPQGDYLLLKERYYNCEFDSVQKYYLRNIDDAGTIYMMSSEKCKEALIRAEFCNPKSKSDNPNEKSGIKDYDFDYVGYYKNRFYFNFHVENLDQEMVSQSFDVLFSFDAKKKKLRYEKELTEYIQGLGSYKYISSPEFLDYKAVKFRVNLAWFSVIEGDELFFYYDRFGTYHCAKYNLSTKTTSELSKEEYHQWILEDNVEDEDLEEDESIEDESKVSESEEDESEEDKSEEDESEEDNGEENDEEDDLTWWDDCRVVFWGQEANECFDDYYAYDPEEEEEFDFVDTSDERIKEIIEQKKEAHREMLSKLFVYENGI